MPFVFVHRVICPCLSAAQALAILTSIATLSQQPEACHKKVRMVKTLVKTLVENLAKNMRVNPMTKTKNKAKTNSLDPPWTLEVYLSICFSCSLFLWLHQVILHNAVRCSPTQRRQNLWIALDRGHDVVVPRPLGLVCRRHLAGVNAPRTAIGRSKSRQAVPTSE